MVLLAAAYSRGNSWARKGQVSFRGEALTKKLFFWGGFGCGEFAGSFCTAWERVIGPVQHHSFRRDVTELGFKEALKQGLKAVEEGAADFVVNWQGHYLTATESDMLRFICDKIGAKFIFVNLDDPYYILEHPEKPFIAAHSVVTCCLEAIKMYQQLGVKNVIFAPPASSVENHIVKSDGVPNHDHPEEKIFFFFTNPYSSGKFKEWGCLNRFEAIQELIRLNCKVVLAIPEHLFNSNYLSEGEWSHLEYKGFVKYEELANLPAYSVYHNGAGAGKHFLAFNQRVFEILGMGGIQTCDDSPSYRRFWNFLASKVGVPPEDSPVIFFDSVIDFAKSVQLLIQDQPKVARMRAAARQIRQLWTFDKLVKRIAFGERAYLMKLQKGSGRWKNSSLATARFIPIK